MITSLPKVAVILCTYNPSSFLHAQLSSIYDQVGVLVDIYIFDDGSLDTEFLQVFFQF